MQYTEVYLKELDKKIEMILLYNDKMFKAVMIKNSNIFKRFLIDTLKLNIDYKRSNIIFSNEEFPKEIDREKGKIIDINVLVNNKYSIDVEMNYYYDEEIMAKSSVYFDKLRSSMIEVNEDYSNIFDYDIYQLNLNKGSKLFPLGENIIVSYDITTNSIFPDHKKVYLKNLDYYSSLYYNLDRNLSFDEMFMVALTTNNFSDLNKILSKILNLKEKNKFLESVINMSQNKFILHAWEKDKLDKWEREHRDKRIKNESIEQNTIDMIKAMLENNADYEFISKVSNKSIEEIKEIEKM